ncbi:DUF6053 domain-containing protein [Lysobacter capsici]|uniref:DUF6053 domain-containing protein n=1 Tax=Lysobacter capsici TaxID=435897 RepID=UPI003D2F86F2
MTGLKILTMRDEARPDAWRGETRRSETMKPLAPAKSSVGGPSGPTLFVPLAPKLHRCSAKSVGLESPPTKANAIAAVAWPKAPPQRSVERLRWSKPAAAWRSEAANSRVARKSIVGGPSGPTPFVPLASKLHRC